MKLCQVCGKPIPADRKSNNTKYCSLKCGREVEKRSRISVIAKKAYRHNAIALYVYSAYDHRCALCGWQATDQAISINGKIQYAHGNEIHHITPVKEGGSDSWENVILLCPNHHKQADMGIISREDLRSHTRPYTLTADQKAEAIVKCADAVAEALF